MQRRNALLALILPLALTACGSNPSSTLHFDDRAEEQGRTIEVRTVVEDGTPFQLGDETFTLSGPTRFRVSRAFPTESSLGQPALGFEIADEDRRSFEEFTATLIDEPMAVLVDGDLLAVPRVAARLPGKGVIEGGANGFARADVERWVAALQPR